MEPEQRRQHREMMDKLGLIHRTLTATLGIVSVLTGTLIAVVYFR